MAKQTPSMTELSELIPVQMPFDLTAIIDSYLGTPFCFTVNMTAGVFGIPFIETAAGFSVDWGDNETEDYHGGGGTIRHEYRTSGKFVVNITGIILRISCDRVYELVEISQWGSMRLSTGEYAFSDCWNLVVTARDAPRLISGANLSSMFAGCKSLAETDFSRWDMSKVVNTSSMFFGCVRFTSDLSQWNVSRVATMSQMFRGCESFNVDLSKWNPSSAIDLSGMFRGCRSFNSDLTRWRLDSAKLMERMFDGCSAFTFGVCGMTLAGFEEMASDMYWDAIMGSSGHE